MAVTLRRSALFAAYQLSLMLGILLLPVALVLRRSVGIGLPIHRVLDALQHAYEEDESTR